MRTITTDRKRATIGRHDDRTAKKLRIDVFIRDVLSIVHGHYAMQIRRVCQISLYFGLMRGKSWTSRSGFPAMKAKRRSPKPKPQVGGMPYSSISTNSWSAIIASLSPDSKSFCCRSNRAAWSLGSLISDQPLPTSLPAISI